MLGLNEARKGTNILKERKLVDFAVIILITVKYIAAGSMGP